MRNEYIIFIGSIQSKTKEEQLITVADKYSLSRKKASGLIGEYKRYISQPRCKNCRD